MRKEDLAEVLEDYRGMFSRGKNEDFAGWLGEEEEEKKSGMEREIEEIATALVAIQNATREETEDGEDEVGENAPTIMLIGRYKWGRGKTFARALRNLGQPPVAMVISEDPEIRMDAFGGIVYDGRKGYTLVPMQRDARNRFRGVECVKPRKEEE